MCDTVTDPTTGAKLVKIEGSPEQALPGEHAERPNTTDAEATPAVLGKVERPHLHLAAVHLEAARDVTAKLGVGLLRRVVINSAPAGMNGVLTIRDGTQGGGAVLAVIAPVAGGQPASLNYDLPFTKGLFLSLVGATPGDWSVIYE